MLELWFLAYLIGSVPTAYLLGRWCGRRDIREVGSGNAGATNVAKSVGWLPGLLTLAVDMGKGYLAAMVGEFSRIPVIGALTPAFAVAGHNWPVWLRFRGGSGLATFIGACLRLSSLSLPLAALALWGLVSLTGLGHDRSAILACILLPLLALILSQPTPLVIFVSGSSLAILARRLQCMAWPVREWSGEGRSRAQ